MYGSIDEPTVWAEWSQATDGGVAPGDDPRWLCIFEADLAVVDLRLPGVRAALGVTVEELTASWAPGSPNRACLKVRDATTAAGADAMIVPSAARAGGWNLDVLPTGFANLRRVRRRRTTPRPQVQRPA
jgi:RES domain